MLVDDADLLDDVRERVRAGRRRAAGLADAVRRARRSWPHLPTRTCAPGRPTYATSGQQVARVLGRRAARCTSTATASWSPTISRRPRSPALDVGAGRRHRARRRQPDRAQRDPGPLPRHPGRRRRRPGGARRGRRHDGRPRRHRPGEVYRRPRTPTTLRGLPRGRDGRVHGRAGARAAHAPAVTRDGVGIAGRRQPRLTRGRPVRGAPRRRRGRAGADRVPVPRPRPTRPASTSRSQVYRALAAALGGRR